MASTGPFSVCCFIALYSRYRDFPVCFCNTQNARTFEIKWSQHFQVADREASGIIPASFLYSSLGAETHQEETGTPTVPGCLWSPMFHGAVSKLNSRWIKNDFLQFRNVISFALVSQHWPLCVSTCIWRASWWGTSRPLTLCVVTSAWGVSSPLICRSARLEVPSVFCNGTGSQRLTFFSVLFGFPDLTLKASPMLDAHVLQHPVTVVKFHWQTIPN